MNITLVCEDSFEGIMTAIYEGWILMNQGNQVDIYPGDFFTPTFFSEYRSIKVNYEKSEKVARSIQVKISVSAYIAVYRACMHYSPEKGNIVFNFLKVAYPQGAKVMKMLGMPEVVSLMELERKVANETHNLKGFLRFSQLEGGLMVGTITPRCNVVPLLEKHFSERFPKENWMIYDKNRKIALLHSNNGKCIMVVGQQIEHILKEMKIDDEYEGLWKVFFNTIQIEERKNSKAQQNHLPKWYREEMTEFQS
ncbi:MAG: TIGR03915 family putative DNA repair protein [Eubacterium sp.]|nr:TIGR03915 family putative DNA repair protein [Eubacterium sp.]